MKKGPRAQKKEGGGGIDLGNAKDREAEELKQMLDMDQDSLGPGKLSVIDPAKWKNQPVSLVQAIRILKEQQLIGIDNFFHIKRFLEKFTKKVLAFIATNDQEIMLMKNKVTRDLAEKDRATDDKIKALRNMLNEITGSAASQNEVTFEIIK